MRKKHIQWLSFLAIAAAACSSVAAEASSALESALSSTYRKSNVRDEGDGVTSYVACFDTEVVEAKGCDHVAFVYYDAPRNARFFTPPKTRLSRYRPEPYLGSAVFLLDCKKPFYLLQPYYFSKHNGLSMNQATVMFDGKVVYKKIFKTKNVESTRESYGVDELTDLIVDEQALAVLRKVAKGGKTKIRLDGEQGHAYVPQKEADKFGQDVTDALAIYDALSAAITPEVQKACMAGK